VKAAMNTQLIAACGMNCAVCLAYLRERKPCDGCRGSDTNKSPSCVRCVIRNCEHIKSSRTKLCYDCAGFPCTRLKQLDKRYRTRYAMSMLQNLESIRQIGLRSFVEKEKDRWRCGQCGGVICVHRGYCLSCRKLLLSEQGDKNKV
jgi:hypothetical protein